jgi:hypothetical protein
MARTATDELKYCIEHRACFDCHAAGIIKAAVKLQRRGKLIAPLCRTHFNAYRSKINLANAPKYLRRSVAKQQAGECVVAGCHHKLIPPELLPPWMRERTCGLHGTFKAFRVNRYRLASFITQHYLTDEQRKSATAQNIIYEPGEAFAFFAVKTTGYYHTKIFTVKALLEHYHELQH